MSTETEEDEASPTNASNYKRRYFVASVYDFYNLVLCVCLSIWFQNIAWVNEWVLMKLSESNDFIYNW